MRIFSLGDNAVTVEFGNEVSLEHNSRSIALAERIKADPFPGFIEIVPAYSSATVFYDIAAARNSFPEFDSAFEAVTSVVECVLQNLESSQASESRTIDIPVRITANDSLDLSVIADWSGLSPDEVLSIFFARPYRVYMIGFLPGFAYMGEVDARIAIPRRNSPRFKVPPGSVAIGGKQTGVYPLESPGGWHIIGRTDVKMFDPGSAELCPLRPGDQVSFVRE